MASAMSDRPLFKVMVLGDSGVGKTSLLRRYTSNVFKEEQLQRPSIGADVVSKFDAEAGVALQLWDTPGQDRYACIAAAFLRGCHALLLVFDVKSMASFRNLDRWYALFASQMPLDPGQRIPVVIVGNKADSDWRAGSSSSSSMISDEMVRDWCANKGDIPYFYTSAKDAINVDQPFRQIVQDCVALHRSNSYSISLPRMFGFVGFAFGFGSVVVWCSANSSMPSSQVDVLLAFQAFSCGAPPDGRYFMQLLLCRVTCCCLPACVIRKRTVCAYGHSRRAFSITNIMVTTSQIYKNVSVVRSKIQEISSTLPPTLCFDVIKSGYMFVGYWTTGPVGDVLHLFKDILINLSHPTKYELL